jgi:nucleoside-diphosphate-sugar epimerase
MKALVTGVAGFIGSHLAERLLHDGVVVRGVDAITDYYDVDLKRRNLEAATRAGLDFVEGDLVHLELRELLDGVDVVFHQAGQPGVRLSWADDFETYVRRNVLATQRLLEAAKGAGLRRFVYASSSSVYGNASRYPTTEDDLPSPFSPYGVTKLAGEHLCSLYGANFGVPTISLRYFTVYGPRQRPDMAFQRMIDAALVEEPFPMFGGGDQVRDFTFVDDVVAANVAAAGSSAPTGAVVNVSGGSSVSLAETVRLVGELVGSPVPIVGEPSQRGDVARTGGSSARAAELLGWKPKVSLAEGLARQVAWQRETLPVRRPGR